MPSHRRAHPELYDRTGALRLWFSDPALNAQTAELEASGLSNADAMKQVASEDSFRRQRDAFRSMLGF